MGTETPLRSNPHTHSKLSVDDPCWPAWAGMQGVAFRLVPYATLSLMKEIGICSLRVHSILHQRNTLQAGYKTDSGEASVINVSVLSAKGTHLRQWAPETCLTAPTQR